MFFEVNRLLGDTLTEGDNKTRQKLITLIASYFLVVLNLIIQDDSVGFLRRQPGEAHRAG